MDPDQSTQHFDNPLAVLIDQSGPSQQRLDALYQVIKSFKPDYFGSLQAILEDQTEVAEIRSAIAISFGTLGYYVETENNPFLDVLINVSEDPDNQVKNYAAQGLGLTGREEAIPTLLNLLHESDNTVFSSAAESLGRIGEPAVPHLVNLLQDGADDARCIAAWKLGEIGDEEAIKPLAKTIRNHENQEVVALCVWALGEIGVHNNEVLDVLTFAKKHDDPDVYVRADAAMKKVVRHVN